jgi:two-component system torCAD operon response regulator TorR
MSLSSSTNRPHRLLVVAPDFLTGHQMVDYFESHQMRATSAAAPREAIVQLAADEPDLVVLDNRLSHANSFDLLRDIRLMSDVPLIIVGRPDRNAVDRAIALELGADDYITAPIDLRELVAARCCAVVTGDTVLQPIWGVAGSAAGSSTATQGD